LRVMGDITRRFLVLSARLFNGSNSMAILV
jgi:hypothetical protein